MTAELVRGQNHPLPQARLEIRVSAGQPVVAGATLVDEHGTVRGTEWVAHPGAHQLPGLEVSRQAAADHRLAVDLGALPEAAHRVNVLLALPTAVGFPARFGAVAAPFVAVTGLDGDEVATFTLTGLDAESAVVALELYRRQDAWKVRAVGQGYAGGLAELLADQGLAQAGELAAAIQDAVGRGLARSVAPPPPRTADGDRARQTARQGAAAQDGVRGSLTGAGTPAQPAPVPQPETPQPQTPPDGPIDYSHPRRRKQPAAAATPSPQPPAPPTQPSRPEPPEPGQPPRPVAGDASGWSMEERLYNQVWGMFEDLARTAAAYRSAVDFAESRMEQELDKVLSDPRSRIGGTGDAARQAARAKRDALVEQARAVLDRDLAQLVAESEVVEPALPPAFARWDNPAWHAYKVPMEIPMALRIGDLHLPERPDLHIPLLVRLPLERGLWIDAGRTGSEAAMMMDTDQLRRVAMDTAVAHAARLLGAYPAGEFTVHVIDPAGAASAALAPLVKSGVLASPPAVGAQGVTEVLARLTERVDLVQMAIRAGASDALPPHLDTAEQLLIVNDFPHGFDDRAVTQLRYLADEGPSVGVHLMMVADREDANAYGPVLDPLWRSLLRLTPVPDAHLADPWVGHAWTYEPLLAPPGSQVLWNVLSQVAAARRAFGR
ncbi:export associated protein [Streptomyces spiroverticillatus]|uniref:Export associated protein n=1 Tax=Streptomyces finlayi TaxID=67296 RepID=A0A918WXP5_9ACTN|nr:TerD family protein [Streptomyces finlayi]GGZ92008.1 export associated protein [Streptomyces spiroverticillatus]GHC93366.1 export associated protein [Streptomyces finlayi]